MQSVLFQAQTSPKSRLAIAAPAIAERWRMAALCLFSAAFLYFDLFRWPLIPMWRGGDQSIFLEHAERMLHGAELYRDLFQFNMPGTEWLYYLLLRWFGVHLVIAPLATLVAGVITTCLIYSLSRRVMPGTAALFPPILYLVLPLHSRLDATHHTFSMMLMLLAVNVIAERMSTVRVAAAGTLLGMACVFTSSKGVLVLFAVAVYLLCTITERRRQAAVLGALLLPFSVIVSGVLLYLVHRVGAQVLYNSIVVFPLKYYGGNLHDNGPFAQWYEIKDAFPLTIHSLPLITVFACLAVPFVLLAFFAGPVRKNWTELRESVAGRNLLLYALVGSAAVLGVMNSVNSLRLTCAFPFGTIVAFWALRERMNEVQFRGLLLIPLLFGVSWVAADHCRVVRRIDSPRGTILMFRTTSQPYSWIVRNARPGDYLFGDPDLNLVTGLPNSTPLPWVSNDAYTRPEQVKSTLEDLEQSHTRFIAASEDDWYGLPNTPENPLKPFSAYLRAHYRPAHKFEDGTEIFERLSDNSGPHVASSRKAKSSSFQTAQNQ